MSSSGVPENESGEHDAFFAACAAGDAGRLRDLLRRDPDLVRARDGHGATGLHLAVPHPEAVRVLLEHGADPNARESGDNALPLHFAAGGGHVESAHALLDAGADVQGEGDVHALDTIGWATVVAEPQREIVDLLVARGARHHVFSAIALGALDLLRRLVADDPSALARRLSGFEQEQTALHYAVAPADGLVGGTFRTGDHYPALEVLIELGADLDARDAKGRTALEVAMLRGDRAAMRILHAAGARLPEPLQPSRAETDAGFESAIRSLTPMLAVPDIGAAVAWYQSIGFELVGSHAHDGGLDWASVRFGDAEIMFAPSSDPWRGTTSSLSLWIRTDRLDHLYLLLKRRQMDRARAELVGEPVDGPLLSFTCDLHSAFYGQREFSIRDPNGVDVSFYEPITDDLL